MRLHIDYARAFYELLFTDKVDIYRKVKTKNPDGTVGTSGFHLLYESIDCKLSFGENDDSAHDTGFMLEGYQPIKIFLPVGTDVLKGDKVVAHVIDYQGNELGKYSGILNLPKHYTTKIEVSFVDDRVA